MIKSVIVFGKQQHRPDGEEQGRVVVGQVLPLPPEQFDQCAVDPDELVLWRNGVAQLQDKTTD